MRTRTAGLAALLALASAPAAAQDGAKIGFVATFSGAAAVIGNDMRDAFELALDHLGRKVGGLPVQVVYEDDQQKPEVGKQKTDKLIEADRVNFLTGYIWSNVLLASLKPAVDAQTFLISANAGPAQIAGELCSPWFFSVSWQGDQVPQAIGEYLNQKGVKSAFLIAPNYAAGKDVLAGLKANFKGSVAAEEYTKWPDQLDFSVELAKARAAKPDAVFAFYPGAAGIQFLTQYAQAGLKAQVPLSTPSSSSTRCRCRGSTTSPWAFPAHSTGSMISPTPQTRSSSPTSVRNTAAIRRSTPPRPTIPPSSSTARWPRSTATSRRRMRCARRCATRATPRCAAPTATATIASRSSISICRRRSRMRTAPSPSRRSPPRCRTTRIAITRNAR